MHVANLTRALQDVFLVRLDRMVQSSDDSDSEGGEERSEFTAVPTATLVASAVFVCLQRQLRLAMEINTDDSMVTLFQTPLYCRHALPLDLSEHDTTAVFHE